MIRKKAKILEKVAKTVSKPKGTKIFTPKPNLKVQNIYNKPLVKPQNTYNKLCFETSYLGENVKNCLNQIRPKCCDLFGLLHDPKSRNWHAEVAQLAKIAQSGHPGVSVLNFLRP